MQFGKFNALRLLAGVGLAVVVSASAASADTILLDGDFTNTAFVGGPNPPGNQGFIPGGDAISFGIANGSGLPGNAVQVRMTNNNNTLNADKGVGIGFLDNLLTYNPSLQGAIISINASASKLIQIFNNQSGALVPQAVGSNFGIILQQGGRYYETIVAQANAPGPVWETVTATNLTQASFQEICLVNCGSGNYANTNFFPPNSQPNFDGPLITFGLLFSNKPTQGFNTLITYDNLNFDISATPLPSTWAMMLGGFALLGFFLYRRRDLAGSFGALA